MSENPIKIEPEESVASLRPTKPCTEKGVNAPPKNWHDFVGALKASPHFNECPVTEQQRFRHEWN